MGTNTEHIELLSGLAKECEALGVTLYHHSYDELVFGSWSVIVGHPHDRLEFTWDGKESYLAIGESQFANQNSRPDWKPVFPSISGTQTTHEEVFEFIVNKVRERYAT